MQTFKEVEVDTVMAEPVAFSSEWVVQIKAMLHDDDDENCEANGNGIGRAKADAILRVPTPLLKTKPEAYIPQFLSIGPYHHSSLEKDIESSCAQLQISTAEMYKAKSAARFSQELRKRGKSIVDMMEKMRPEIEGFYHLPPSESRDAENSQNFALMMAVDSSFLLDLLIFLWTPHEENDMIESASTPPEENEMIESASSLMRLSEDNRMMIELGPLHECIKCDILKLENQMPLAVLKGVFENIDGSDLWRQRFDQLLQKTMTELSPFWAYVCNDGSKLPVTVNVEKHLLGCMHAFIAPILQMPSEPEQKVNTLWQILKLILEIPVITLSYFLPTATFERRCEIALNAEKLAKGIQFKPSNKIRFDEYSGTFYLPEINIWETHMEVLLRNLVAMEFNDPRCGNAVICYVSLMNCLIQNPQDVRVLRDCGVIRTNPDVGVIMDRRAVRTNVNMLTEERIAKMWNDLGQPFFTSHLGSNSDDLGRGLLAAIWKNYRKTKIKSYLSSWKFLLPIAGYLVFAMTVIQTYCSLYQISITPPSPPA